MKSKSSLAYKLRKVGYVCAVLLFSLYGNTALASDTIYTVYNQSSYNLDGSILATAWDCNDFSLPSGQSHIYKAGEWCTNFYLWASVSPGDDRFGVSCPEVVPGLAMSVKVCDDTTSKTAKITCKQCTGADCTSICP